jgi:hypothetical protein
MHVYQRNFFLKRNKSPHVFTVESTKYSLTIYARGRQTEFGSKRYGSCSRNSRTAICSGEKSEQSASGLLKNAKEVMHRA